MKRNGFLAVVIFVGMLAGAEGVWGQTRPAEVGITVLDLQSRPIAGARVVFTSHAGKVVDATAQTDEHGKASVKLELTEEKKCGAMEDVAIEKEGMGKFDAEINVFDGAKVEQTLVLNPARTTVVHVRGPKGELVEGVALGFKGGQEWPVGNHAMMMANDEFWRKDEFAPMTDVRGDYRARHEPFQGSCQVEVWGSEHEDAGPVAVKKFNDTEDEVTVTLSEEALEKVYPTRVLEGKLVLADGSPATKWLVGEHVERDTGMSVSAGTMESIDDYVTEKLAHPGANGGFVIRAPSGYLAIVSPEGYQFIYCLNPWSWGGGVHRVTLTVPGVRRILKTQLVDEAGKGVAGVPVRLWEMRSGSYVWTLRELRQGTTWDAGQVGNAELKMVSDENGWIDLPRYLGARDQSYHVGRLVFDESFGDLVDEYTASEMGMSSKVKLEPWGRPGETSNRVKMSHIILGFMDETGKQVNDERIERLSAGPRDGEYGQSQYVDAKGLHYFLRSSDTHIDLETADGTYRRVEKTIELEGRPVQEITIQLQHNKAVSGRVVDAAGKPAEGMSISLYTKGASDREGTTALDLRTTTDAAGHFAYVGAPDECFAYVSHEDAATHQSDVVPVEDVQFTADKREVEIHLSPAGSVRVLLPEGDMLATPFYFSMLLPNDAGEKTVSSLMLDPDAGSRTLCAAGIKPGRYHLNSLSFPGMGDLSDVQIVVKGGEETVVDLRKHAVEKWAGGKLHEMTAVVEREGKAISGAEVAVFDDVLPPEVLLGRYEAWRKATTEVEMNEASGNFYEGAGAALDVIPTVVDDPALQARLTQLRDDLGKEPDGLRIAAMDLSDDSGRIRFSIREGRTYVAVARVRGKLMGMKKFTVSDKEDLTVRIAMDPMRALVLHRPAGAEHNYPFTQPFTIEGKRGIERRCMMRSLSNDHLWGSVGDEKSLMPEGDDFVFDGLPVGTKVSIPWGEKAKEVTIEAGEGAEEVDVP